jgi:DNA-binding NarL/FixJ family response regulator
MPRDWPLTGRSGQQARAVAALRESGGVVLAGAAGVGKTRLAREIIADAGRRGRTTRWVGATASSRNIPLGAFAALVAEAGGGTELTLLGRVGAALRGAVEVLAVDDAHLLDDVSATLLHQLALERTVRLVVTVRQGEPAPDAVTTLWKDTLLERLEVPGLDERDTVALVESVLGDELETASGQRLFAVTRGNVLLLRHLVAGERRSGRLAPVDGQWRWLGEPEIGPELRDLIDARIGLLTEQDRRLLELVAFGEPVGAELLGSLVGHPVVESAAERGLIVVSLADRRLEARLAHPLYGEAVRARAGSLRARRRRGELFRALASTGHRRTGDVLRLAVLSLDSDTPADAALLGDAATEAAALSDWGLAERLCRAACDAGGGFEPRLALGLTLSWTVRPDEAEPELELAAALAATGEQRARAAGLRAANRGFLQGRPAEAIALLDEAGAALCDGDTAARLHLDGVRAMFELALDRLGEGLALGTRVLGSPGAQSFAVSWAGYAVVCANALRGRTYHLDELVDRVVAAAVSSSETAPMQFNVRYWQAYGLGLAGHPGRAREHLAWLRELPGRYATAARDATGGRIALDSGQVRTAARQLRAILPFFPGRGGGWTALFEAALAQALAMAGDATQARDALARAELSRHPLMRCVEPEITLARAWVAAAEGAVGQSIELAVAAAELAGASGQLAVEVVARHAAVCFGDTRQAAALAGLADRVDGPRAPSAAAHAAALAARDPDALLAVAGELERSGLVLLAADCAAQAAEEFRAQGRAAPAAFAGARAAALAQRCEDARTPALRAGTAPPISAREREVATLAATGLSNRQIAERLHVSVRTVEGHIYRACTRLGLADRAALADLVGSPISRA